MRCRIIRIAALAAILGLLPATGAVADSGSATFQYLVGTGFLCMLPVPSPCPDVARADNGDTVAIGGSGVLSIHPMSVTGSGTFTHRNAQGSVRATGTWTSAPSPRPSRAGRRCSTSTSSSAGSWCTTPSSK
jgi:hypothetical protein